MSVNVFYNTCPLYILVKKGRPVMSKRSKMFTLLTARKRMPHEWKRLPQNIEMMYHDFLQLKRMSFITSEDAKDFRKQIDEMISECF